MTTWGYPFDPYPKQQQALRSAADELLFGGSLGGGKSELLLAACVDLCTLVPNAKALLVRRTFPELQELRKRLRDRIPGDVARENKADNIFTFYNGAQLILRYLDNEEDATRLQGFEIQLACVERSTPVLMGDGTWKRIDTIKPGEYVHTMEGPRRVNKSMHMGVKPVYEVRTRYGATKVARGHRIYTPHGWFAPEELTPTGRQLEHTPSAWSPATCPTGGKLHECSPTGRGQERGRIQPRLPDTGRPEVCACGADCHSGSVASDGGSREAPQPPAWCVPLVLTSPPRPKSPSGDDAACAPAGSGVPGSPCDCPTSHGSCDARGSGALAESTLRACTPSPVGVEPSSPPDQRGGGLSTVHGCSPKVFERYVHPYTSESRAVDQHVVSATGRIAPAGAAEVWDLEVEDANHYVSCGYLTMSNCFDELTHYDESSYALVLSRLRATGQVKADMDRYGFRLRALSASNPGGKGHSWVKERFIEPAPAGEPFTGDDGTVRQFIPSSLYDNPYIDHEDYVRRLGALDPERKRALIEGDWGIPSGVRFPQFREKIHTVAPEELPIDVIGHARVVGVDFGFSDPFAAVWMAKVHGVVVVYREELSQELTATQQAQRILELEAEGERRPERPITVALDPAAWRRDVNHVGPKLGGEDAPLGSIAHSYKQILGGKGGQVVKGMNDRLHGWAMLDELLAVDDRTGLPGILIYNNCRQLIKALSSAPRDKRRPEDVDTHWAQDHLLDGLRYGYLELLGRNYHRKLTGHERLAREGRSDTVMGDVSRVGF